MKRLLDLGLLLAVVAGVVAAFAYLQLDLAGLFSADSLRQMGQYAVRFLQPDLSSAYLASIAMITVLAWASWNSDRLKYSCAPSPPAPTKPRMAAIRMFISQRYRA